MFKPTMSSADHWTKGWHKWDSKHWRGGSHMCSVTGWKRYDNSMSPEQRSSYENGIWLCRNCAAMIDRDEDYYTVDMLHMWKQLAELEASKYYGKRIL